MPERATLTPRRAFARIADHSRSDVNQWDSVLFQALKDRPETFLPCFEEAAREALALVAAPEAEVGAIPAIHIILEGLNNCNTPIRKIKAVLVNKLVCVPGIVIGASKTRAKATNIAMKCRQCGHLTQLACGGAFGRVQTPRRCGREKAAGEAECPLDPYVVVPDKCTYIDQQTLKLQESPEEVPTGEMPRHILLAADRTLASKVVPGTRVSVIGVVSILNTNGDGRSSGGSAMVAVRVPYLRVCGFKVNKAGASGSDIMSSFTPAEEAKFTEIARQDWRKVYARVCSSIAPSISGDYTVDIKKAVACLLFGGSRKLLPDGTRLRGDVHALLLGDPSTAKSQFLKFAEKVAPISVYTSGKGSSAAGLTASVIRDKHGEFYLEGGAMVLADGGIVCIDEFDKVSVLYVPLHFTRILLTI